VTEEFRVLVIEISDNVATILSKSSMVYTVVSAEPCPVNPLRCIE
jgi:hypothetical protein